MCFGVIPPTGNISVSGGVMARSALTTCGEISSAGNNLIALAPASRAASTSVGLSAPGIERRPHRRVARMTLGSVLGETIRRPPASATSETSLAVSTVPAPMMHWSPKWSAIRAMERMGDGEFRGISMTGKPARTSASAIGNASSGVMPRKIATSDRRPKAIALLIWVIIAQAELATQ